MWVISLLSKVCPDCLEEKTYDLFYADKSKKQGVGTRCKECTKARNNKNRAGRKEQYAEYEKERYRRLERQKYYAKIRATPERREYQKQYYEKNKDHWKEKYRPSHKVNEWSAARTAKLKSNGVFAVADKDLRRLVLRSGGLCSYCRKVKWEQWDHVVPISRGGVHSVGNLLPVCADCNRKKSKMPLYRFKMIYLKGAE